MNYFVHGIEDGQPLEYAAYSKEQANKIADKFKAEGVVSIEIEERYENLSEMYADIPDNSAAIE